MTVLHPSEPRTGEAIVHLLRTTHWLGRDPDTGRLRLYRAEDLSDPHRRHVLRWLRQRADELHERSLREADRQHQLGAIDDTEHARLIAPLRDVEPAAWLEDTPLVRRLLELSPPHPRPARRRRWLPTRLLRGDRSA